MRPFILYSIILVVIYSLALITFIVRWKSPYILKRSPLMLSLTLIGNFIQSIVYISQLCELEKDYGAKVFKNCNMFFRIRQSLNVIFHYVLFFPYVLRAYRMYLIFKVDKHWGSTLNKYSRQYHRTRQLWMFVVFLVCMVPFLIMVFIILTDCKLSEYLPASEYDEHKFFSETLYLSISFIEQLFFILAIYYLRNISDDYKMTQELTIAVVTWFATPSLTLFPPINLEKFKSLPGLLRNLILFIISAVYPIICSFFDKNTQEILTIEMIESFESILQSKLPLDQFEKYLKDCEARANDSKIQLLGYNLLGLYMKCENYLMSSEGIEKDELIKDLVDTEFVPVNFVNNSKESFDEFIRIAKENISIMLKDEFFEGFKNNWRFLELKRYVNRQEIYIGRLMKVGLTKTYTCLSE